MSKKISLRKTCSVYASKMHLATMIFPFVKKEIKNGVIVKPILEKDISEDMEHIIRNVSINPKIKEKIIDLNWEPTNIEKIKMTLNDMEELLKQKKNIDIVVQGTNIFIEKINELVDIWAKINLEKIEINNMKVNVINCYSFDDNKEIEEIRNKHDCILKTNGVEEIFNNNNLKVAN